MATYIVYRTLYHAASVEAESAEEAINLAKSGPVIWGDELNSVYSIVDDLSEEEKEYKNYRYLYFVNDEVADSFPVWLKRRNERK